MNKFTPGPWKVSEFGIDGLERIKVTQGSTFICETGAESRLMQPLEQARANAHLIAAAPLMLEVLQKIYEELSAREADYKWATELRIQVANAITKARGES